MNFTQIIQLMYVQLRAVINSFYHFQHLDQNLGFSWANVNIAAFFKFAPVRLPLLVYPKVQCYLL